jgi:uncharacterized protein (DUF433 family)
MTALHQIQQLLAQLTPGEKAAVLQNVVQDLGNAFPGIDSVNGVCGGEPCIVRTRIPVWVLHRMRQSGVSEADILRAYPTIGAEDLANAWRYVRAYLPEIEAQIRANKLKDAHKAIARLRKARAGCRLNGLSIKELRDEGRR